ncbi:MAG: carbon monoxide dehydrogenase [Alphaproteobacteria bacterium]|nr:MAG: carbon monoxide dehydrogenase [Alphaproteobacteria bacterium]
MKLAGETLIPAPRETVWAALNDETLLIQCIPGCEALERIADDELAAAVTAKVGPVKATFKGEVRLENVSPPHSYTLIGQGKGAAGFARGRADVSLHDAEDGATQLVYSVEANVGGKLAQLGARLIESSARKYAEDFFATFSRLVAERAPAAAETTAGEAAPAAEEEPVEAAPRPGLPPAVWAVVLILLVLLLLYLFVT